MVHLSSGMRSLFHCERRAINTDARRLLLVVVGGPMSASADVLVPPCDIWHGSCERNDVYGSNSSHCLYADVKKGKNFMSQQNLLAVQRFNELIETSESMAPVHDLLADDASYLLMIAKTPPLRAELRGRKIIAEYLEMISITYQVLEVGPRRFFAVDNRVIVFGSESAYLVISGETVEAEWCSVFECEDGLIQRVTMSVYRWNPNVFASGLSPITQRPMASC